MAELAKLKKSRTAHRVNTNKLLEKFKNPNYSTLTETQKLDEIDDLNSNILTLQSKHSLIKSLDEKIMELLSEDEEIADELTATTDYELKVQKHVSKLKRLQRQLEIPCVNVNVAPIATGTIAATVQQQAVVERMNDGVRLPKIEISQFKGDPLEWNAFRDTFTATIHKNSKLSDIEKFTYLQSYVRDEAQQAIQGLPLSGENYNKAWELLTERFGNSQLIRSSLMNKLIKLEKPSNGSAKELRKLYDTIESNVRALKSTGIEKETLGPMLIPIVLEKLPNVVRLHLSRTLGSNTWDITEFLKAINDEILARENFDYLKDPEKEGPKKGSSSMNFGSAQQKNLQILSK